MRGLIIRKILVVMIIIAPVVSYSGCKKQAKCGCGKDVLFTLENTQARVYFTDASSISAILVNDPYSTYTFCNPSEMYPKLKDLKSGDVLLLSGSAYWDCNYVYQQSNYSYQTSYMKIYNIQVSDVYQDLYGKK